MYGVKVYAKLIDQQLIYKNQKLFKINLNSLIRIFLKFIIIIIDAQNYYWDIYLVKMQ